MKYRPILVVLLVGGACAAAAESCTTFNFPYAEPPDGAPESSNECGSSPGAPNTYLSLDDAARVCSLVAICPDLAITITASVAVPLDFTQTSFSACMNWLAGSVSSAHIGFPTQQSMFQCMAAASTCDAAYACAYIRPLDAGLGPCSEGCVDGGSAIVRCVNGVALESPCSPPLWEDGGSCFFDNLLKAPFCGTSAAGCSPGGLSCAGATTLSYCPATGAGSNAWSLDCEVFGEVCVPGTPYNCDSPLDASVCGPVVGSEVGCTPDSRAIRYCNQQPRIHTTFDCTLSGRTCALSSAGLPFCKGCNDTCTPFDTTMNQCSGSNVTICVDGVSKAYDCAAIGKQCLTQNGGHCG
jgi:hypothetical protein